MKEEFSKECERLEGEINNLRQELAKKVEEIIGLRKEIEEKDEEISGLKRRNKELNEANERVEAENIEQQQTISEKDKRIGELEKALKQKGEEINRLTVSNNRKDKIISEQGQRIEMLEGELNEKRTGLGTAEKKVTHLQEKLKSFRVEEVSKKTEELEGKVEKLEGTIRGLEENIRYKYNAEVVQLKGQLNTKDIELESKRRECEALKSEKNDFEQQKQELEEARRKNAELEEKVRELSDEISGLQRKLDEMEQLRIQLQNVQESKTVLEEDFNNRSNTLNEGLKSDVIKLKQELEESLTQNSDLRGNNESLEQLERELRNQIGDLKRELEIEKVQHEEELEVLRNKLKEAEVEKNRLEEQIEALKEDNAQKWKILTVEEKKGLLAKDAELKRVQTDLSQKNENLNAKFNREKDEVKRQKKIVSERDGAIDKLIKEKKQLVEVFEETQRELAKQKELVKKLESERKQIEKRVKDLEDKLKTDEDSFNKLQKAKKQSDEDLEETQKELTEQKESVEKLESELKQIEDLTKKVEELQKEKDGVEEELQKVNRALAEQKSNLEGKVKELEKQIDIDLAEVNKLQEEKEELEDKYDNMVETNMDSIKLLNAQNEKLRGGESEEINRLNQELQRVENELKAANKIIARLRKENQAPQREEPQPQQKQVFDGDSVSVSRISVKLNSRSLKLKFLKAYRSANRLLDFQSLKDFLTDQNIELKKSFPEFEGKHFCHTAVEEVEKCLSKENGGKFEIEELLTLLESKLEEVARSIMHEKVRKVINDENYYNKMYINVASKRVTNDNSEIDNTVEKDLKSVLLPSIEKCVQELKHSKEDVESYTSSIIDKFKQRKPGNKYLGKLLEEIVVKEFVDTRMEFFTIIISEEGYGIASSIRSKFLSPDQKRCKDIPGEINTYQLSQHIIDKHKNSHNSDAKKSSAPKPRMDQPSVNESYAASVPVAAPKQRSGFLGGLFNR